MSGLGWETFEWQLRPPQPPFCWFAGSDQATIACPVAVVVMIWRNITHGWCVVQKAKPFAFVGRTASLSERCNVFRNPASFIFLGAHLFWVISRCLFQGWVHMCGLKDSGGRKPTEMDASEGSVQVVPSRMRSAKSHMEPERWQFILWKGATVWSA